MTKHTALPYRVESHGTTPGNTTIEVHGADGVVAVVSYWGGGLHGLPNDIRQANAEFICRACNNHAKLVAALRLIHRDLGRISPKIFDEEISDEAKRAMESALANATKEAP